MVLIPAHSSVLVVTVQVLEVVLPTVTVAVAVPPGVVDDTRRMLMEFPEAKPLTLVVPHWSPLPVLIAIPTQPVPQVAVSDPVKPLRATSPLATVTPPETPVWFVKLKALGVLLFVVTDQVPETVAPTVTVAVVVELRLDEDVCWMAMVSPDWNPESVVQVHQVPLWAIFMQPVPHVAVAAPVKPLNVTALLDMVMPWLTPVWLVNENVLGVLLPAKVTQPLVVQA